jgi:hypothetical protein
MVTQPPIIVDLTAKKVALSRHLGALANALLSDKMGRSLLVSFGANASEPQVMTGFNRWMDRNVHLLRARVHAMAYVVPSLWVRIQWRAWFLLCQPHVKASIHKTNQAALRWLEIAGRTNLAKDDR